MTTVQGRLGSQYTLSAIDTDQPGDAERYRLQVQLQIFPLPVTLWSGDYTTATKIMDFCQQHDGLAIDAAQKLYALGDPTALLELITQAVSDPLARARRRVGINLAIETDVLESEDAIVDVSQRMTAAARMCGVTVRGLTCDYNPLLEPGKIIPVEPIGVEYCWKSVVQALQIKGELSPRISKAILTIDKELGISTDGISDVIHS
jgi:hypothetical protein